MSNKWNEYKVADLDQDVYHSLVEKESTLNSETGKQFILIAYEKK